jgi:hypothetical protein
VAQSHTPNDHCVRFAVVVTFPDATLVTKRALPLTWAGLSPAGSRQLRLAHRYINLTLPPFGLGKPRIKIPDFLAPAPPRYLALWSREEVSAALEGAVSAPG